LIIVSKAYLLWYSKIMVDFQAISLTVDRKDIFYVNYVVQGYDGLGTVSTKDPLQGLLVIHYPECSKTPLLDLISALQIEGVIKEVHEL
jgi:hypothetical protein